jgi:hypothetical protein
MDDMNVHQFLGISPFIDLLAATSSTAGRPGKCVQQQQENDAEPLCLLQVQLE